MEKLIDSKNIDITPRPNFSRFEQNLKNESSLPIYPLAFPSNGHVGAVLIGDYIAQDFINHASRNDPSFRKNWIILTTTQSDSIPADCRDVDFNFFTNKKRVADYLNSPAKNVPFSTELGDAHYVDPTIFTPEQNVAKVWDIFYAAKWYPTKRTELLIEAARIDKNLQIAIYGWPVVSERKIAVSREYRDFIKTMSEGLTNIQIFDSGFELESVNHINPDGSFVLGNLSKAEMRDMFFRKSRSTVFLSETTEAVNRSCVEMLCCDNPILVAPTDGGMEDLVNTKTGTMIERSAQGIIDGLRLIKNKSDLDPRSSFLEHYGKENANKKLKSIIQKLAQEKGREVNWKDFKDYGGDLWTTTSVYSKVFKI